MSDWFFSSLQLTAPFLIYLAQNQTELDHFELGLGIIDFFGKIKVLNALAGLDVRFKIISVVRLRSDLFFTCLYILN